MKKSFTLRNTLITVLVLSFSNSYIADNIKKPNEIYKVELIVFTNNVSPDKLYSNFDKLNIPKKINILKEKPIRKESEEEVKNEEPLIIEQNPLPELYIKLDPENYNLKTFDKKLSLSNNHKIITHYAWYQDLSKKSETFFNGGQNYSEKEKNIANTDIISNSNNDFIESNKIDFNNSDKINNNYFKFLNPEWELEGFIELQKFTRSKVHVDMNLLINTPVKLAGYLHYKTFSIKQNINAALNEAVYFDNPYFGAILYISKYENA